MWQRNPLKAMLILDSVLLAIVWFTIPYLLGGDFDRNTSLLLSSLLALASLIVAVSWMVWGRHR